MSRRTDLFEDSPLAIIGANAPLAARMRPRSIEEIVGQKKILGPGKLLRRAIEADRLNSLILYGPPGCGKTTLAEVIARVTHREFERTSGVVANVSILRDLLKRLRGSGRGDSTGDAARRGPILFIDEIHRFNKAQQDVLLPYVEDGTVTLIGATTHNPLFFINSPLVSRSLIFQLEPLSDEDVAALIRRALDDERGLQSMNAKATDEAIAHLAAKCEGDARRALNALEIAALSTPPGPDGAVSLTVEIMEDSIQKKAVVYDHDEDGHYDAISAFIKSVRGSDPHAAVYWLGKMLYAGEDPRFIARRLVILASEDIGNADPRGLTLAVSAMHAVELVGMPEARIVLSQATTYLATAPKSNASYRAIERTMEDINRGRVLKEPERLKNIKLKVVSDETPKKDEYIYPHDFEGHFVEQEYIPTLSRYYEPSDQGYETTIGKRMAVWDSRRISKVEETSGRQRKASGEGKSAPGVVGD